MRVIFFLIASFCSTVIFSGVKLPAYIISKLEPGDIIIRKGGGALSYQLMQISGENYSHCGIVVSHKGSTKIIQAHAQGETSETDGVQLTSVHDFVKYTADSMLFICRPVVDSSKNYLLAERAFYYLEKAVPFDHRFNLEDPKKFYCSELLIHLFLDVFGEKVMDVRRQHRTWVPLFSSFFDEQKFRPVFQLKATN